jgi:nicotinate-nucleotide pyrophosphorylase (carboxylating)
MRPGTGEPPELDPGVVREAVERALAEDRAEADVTTRAIFGETDRLTGVLVARAPGVLAGLPLAAAVFRRLDATLEFEASLRDGDRLEAGSRIARARGSAWGLLSGERTALNFLQRLSGIATLTAAYVEAVAGTGVRILDTRKTTPGLRALEKYAVRVGGGENHRASLAGMALVKDNHVAAAGSIAAAVARVRASAPGAFLEVEVQSLDELREALDLAVDRVMLDNFDPETARRAVAAVRATKSRRPEVEISGGVTLENVASLARAGADFISVGALTHSAVALDMSMDVTGP